jgi:hypothetical protein
VFFLLSIPEIENGNPKIKFYLYGIICINQAAKILVMKNSSLQKKVYLKISIV